MTETVETNAEVNSLLWENLIQAGKDANTEYYRVVQETAVKFHDTITAMFTVFFARNPEVEALAWSQTNEEYDDSTYGGFNWIEMRPRFFKDKMDEETAEYAEQFNDYYQDFVDTNRYSWGNQSTVPALVQRVYADINQLEAALRSRGDEFAQRLFGTDGVVASRGGIQYFGPDDEIKTP